MYSFESLLELDTAKLTQKLPVYVPPSNVFHNEGHVHAGVHGSGGGGSFAILFRRFNFGSMLYYVGGRGVGGASEPLPPSPLTPPFPALRTSHFALRTSHFALRTSNDQNFSDVVHQETGSTPSL